MKQSKSSFRYWRLRILYATFIGYALYYFTRGTLALALPELKKMGYDEVQLGWLLTSFQIAYGISKFGNGLLADHVNPRYFMSLGLMATGVMTILFGFSNSLWVFLFIWTLHGWFQGCGSAPCHRLLAHWYARSERGRWWGVWNTSHNVGAALLPYLGAFLLVRYSWESVMVVPGIIAIFGGFFLMNRLRDTPESLGLPPVDHSEPALKLGYREILQNFILTNPALWVLSVAYFMVYVIRWTLSHWIYHFLVDVHHFESWSAASCLAWYEVGGLVGGLAAGWLSDLLFRGRRNPVHALFLGGVFAATVALQQVLHVGASAAMVQLLMGLMGFFVYGPQMLLAVHAVELTHKNASASAVGFLGIIAYVGAAMTGGPLGALVKHGGWENVFYLLQAATLTGLLAVAALSIITRRKTTGAVAIRT